MKLTPGNSKGRLYLSLRLNIMASNHNKNTIGRKTSKAIFLKNLSFVEDTKIR